jgi:hypothetical protein
LRIVDGGFFDCCLFALAIELNMVGRTKRAVLIAGLAIFVGCKSDPYRQVDVTGKVTTCEGKPAAGGTIVFYPVDDPAASGRPAGNPGREARGKVEDDGTFSLETIGIQPTPGAVVGRHKVAFEMPPTRRRTLTGEDKAGMTPDEIQKLEAEFAADKVYAAIPCSNELAPEEVTVTADGPNVFEFKLQPR